jgi:hypothetical protein
VGDAGGSGPDPDPDDGDPPPEPDPDPSLLLCNCECCRFEQLVKVERMDGIAGPYASAHKWAFDCFWYKAGEDPPQRPLGTSPLSPGEGWELICPGLPDKKGGAWDQIKQRFTRCGFEFEDDPTWPLKQYPVDFHVTVNWEGRIWDKCRSVMRRVEKFALDVSGSLDEKGNPKGVKGSVGGVPVNFKPTGYGVEQEATYENTSPECR